MEANLATHDDVKATHSLAQAFPELVATLPDPSQSDIRAEKNFRRASADFVARHGGDLARSFLNKINDMGLITDDSRFMCQVSPIVEGAYPSPPNWHIDRMPGTAFKLGEHLASPVTGVIACLCSAGRIEATEFLSEGTLELVEPLVTDAVHQAGQYINEASGVMNWTTQQVVEQLKAGTVRSQSIVPNRLYTYDSTYFHKPPRYTHDGGYRMFLRVNTPPAGFPHAVAIDDRILPDAGFYFECRDGFRWERFSIR